MQEKLYRTPSVSSDQRLLSQGAFFSVQCHLLSSGLPHHPPGALAFKATCTIKNKNLENLLWLLYAMKKAIEENTVLIIIAIFALLNKPTIKFQLLFWFSLNPIEWYPAFQETILQFI